MRLLNVQNDLGEKCPADRHSPMECSALSCEDCLLEAREVWALLQQGKKVPEILEYINKTYDPSKAAGDGHQH